jgi:hypothetical protein
MEELFVPIRYLRSALDEYEGERRRLLIYTQAQLRIPTDIGDLDRLVPDGEDEDIAVEVELYGHHVWTTILSNRCELGHARFV